MVDDVEMLDESPIVENQKLNGEEPMEVQVVEGAVENKEDPLKGEYTWVLKGYSSLEDKVVSEAFELGGYSWSLLCFPRGNNKPDQFSLYLAIPEADKALEFEGWQRSASFKLSLLDQQSPDTPLVKETHHVFTETANDWGFTAFCSVPEIEDPTRAFLVDDTLRIKVEITVTHPDEGPAYNSRETTGYVGLRNQGATCYMNSLLQTLYSVNAFRKAVYHMPTSEDEEPSGSMFLALQSVFYKLQFTPGPVSTEDLTASFGWDTADAFQQHDVQELNRILCDRLEEKMKGTRVEGTVNRLFEGHTLNYIDCINIDFQSSRKEAFQDLQLDVKGCKNIYDSFDRYCEVETLEGDNKYEAEGHGKQDARKGVLFENLPPVLNLHLKRFEYDYQKDAMVKINDRYEFYDELDLDKLNKDGEGLAYLTSNADKTVQNKYRLVAVLVHSGGVHGGHYYAFVRPEGEKWLKFDDEAVSIAEGAKAVQENWGGDIDDLRGPTTFGTTPAVRSFSKFSNAYMLVYVRESEWDSVMCQVVEEDISEHVRARLKLEEEEKLRRRKERSEAHMHTMVRIATDDDLKKQIGKTTFFDLVDFDQVDLQIKASKKDTFSEVQKLVAERLGVSVADQRFWRWNVRRNETFRPMEDPLPDDVSDKTINAVCMAHSAGRKSVKIGEMVKFDLYLEVPPSKGKIPLDRNTMILCFFKHYIPGDATHAPQLKYAGKALLTRSQTFGSCHKLLKGKAGLPAEEEIEVYEEVKFAPTVIVELTNPETTLAAAKLEDGDILILQSANTPAECQFPTATEFMQHVRNRVIVTFKRIEGPTVLDNEEKEYTEEESTLELELLKDMKWDDVSSALTTKLGLDHPLKVRLTLQSLYTPMPRPQPQLYNPALTLEDLIKSHGQIPKFPVLYYEPIDLPLPEYERIVTYRVAFHNSKYEETAAVTVRVGKDKTIGDMLEEVRAQLPAEFHKGQPLRLMEVWNWRIWHVFDPNQRVEEQLAKAGNAVPWHLRCEIIPEDQRDLEEEDKYHIHCLQVEDKDKQTRNAFAFSDPFIMAISPSETIGQLKARVQETMEIPDREFESWNVVLVSGIDHKQEFLEDDLVIADKFNIEDLSSRKLYGHSDRPTLGFHHENKNPRRTHAHLNRPSAVMTQERALKIRA